MLQELISANALRERMYHDAFETDSDMQKWDSGCWIRYKMFENALEDAPIVDAVPVVRCKDCKHREVGSGFCEGRGWPLQLVPDDGFCDKGERKEDEIQNQSNRQDN